MPYHVISYLERSFQKYPDSIALSDVGVQLTYSEVWEYVTSCGNALAHRLGKRGVPVAVCLRHDVYDVLCFLSIAYSGNCYVPIDLSLPAERVKHILAVTEPAAIMSRDKTKLPDGTDEQLIISAEALFAYVGNFSDEAPWKACRDTDPLYVIFTSGSTGVPKGVAVSHRSVIDMAEMFQEVFCFRENAVFGNQAPFDFDVSVKDIYLSLKVGGRLEILEKKLFSFPKLLIERLNERKVDTVIWAVPALRIISELDAFSGDKPRFLRDIMFSGEVMPPKTLAYWREKLPGARFVNLYGPTEITCNCTYFVIGDDLSADESIPIGKAFPNCSVFLLDGDTPVQDGDTGEICVAGSCLALGYYNEPELTERAFVQNPLQKAYREYIYRTGDIGRMQNGQLMYMGRRDAQIKHMGHRIELAEIELCANVCDGVEASACAYDEERKRIILFCGGKADVKDVSKHLRGKLPKYMLPSVIEKVDAFPQTRTGKIDRKALLTMAAEKGEEK